MMTDRHSKGLTEPAFLLDATDWPIAPAFAMDTRRTPGRMPIDLEPRESHHVRESQVPGPGRLPVAGRKGYVASVRSIAVPFRKTQSVNGSPGEFAMLADFECRGDISRYTRCALRSFRTGSDFGVTSAPCKFADPRTRVEVAA